MSAGKTFKLGEKVFSVVRRSINYAQVCEGTVIACDPSGDITARVSWHDDSGLCSTTPICDTFDSRESAEIHLTTVLQRPWEPSVRQ